MKINFNVREYVDGKYGKSVLEEYEEDFGLNGLDNLWMCESKEEVDRLLESYLE